MAPQLVDGNSQSSEYIVPVYSSGEIEELNKANRERQSVSHMWLSDSFTSRLSDATSES